MTCPSSTMLSPRLASLRADGESHTYTPSANFWCCLVSVWFHAWLDGKLNLYDREDRDGHDIDNYCTPHCRSLRSTRVCTAIHQSRSSYINLHENTTKILYRYNTRKWVIKQHCIGYYYRCTCLSWMARKGCVRQQQQHHPQPMLIRCHRWRWWWMMMVMMSMSAGRWTAGVMTGEVVEAVEWHLH